MRTFDFATKDFRVKDEGPSEFVFEGYGSLFGVQDRGGDIVEAGAFDRTIRKHNGRFPLVRDHELSIKARLGVAFAQTDRKGVRLTGYVNTETQKGREAKSDIVHAHRHGEPIGLSFGYDVRDDRFDRDENARRLKDVEVYEWSLTQIPQLDQARVTDTTKCRGGNTAEEVTREIRALTREIKRRERSGLAEEVRTLARQLKR